MCQEVGAGFFANKCVELLSVVITWLLVVGCSLHLAGWKSMSQLHRLSNASQRSITYTKDGKIWWNVHVQVPRPLMGHAERDFENECALLLPSFGGSPMMSFAAIAPNQAAATCHGDVRAVVSKCKPIMWMKRWSL